MAWHGMCGAPNTSSRTASQYLRRDPQHVLTTCRARWVEKGKYVFRALLRYSTCPAPVVVLALGFYVLCAPSRCAVACTVYSTMAQSRAEQSTRWPQLMAGSTCIKVGLNLLLTSRAQVLPVTEKADARMCTYSIKAGPIEIDVDPVPTDWPHGVQGTAGTGDPEYRCGSALGQRSMGGGGYRYIS